MSGLAAVFARDGSGVVAGDVDGVLQRQAHRGPDGLRVWCDGSIGLGHAALDPTGRGRVGEPLVVDGGRLAITGDLRIDNRGGLIGRLGRTGSECSDAEVVLEAYRRYGIDTPRFLEGAFAFVIWDGREQRVFCARDHLGLKPLTYHLSRERFVCASEAEAVPCGREVFRGINEARIADLLVSELEGVDHTSTFFEGVVRLAPAHVLVVEADRHQLKRYWRPDVETELRLDSDEAYAEAFASTFLEAVGSCLEGVAAPGLLLSGGIDSNAIAAFAGSLARAGEAVPLATYSAIDEDWDTSPETPSILAAIEHFGVDSMTLSPAGVGRLPSSVRRALLDCGEPFDSSMVVANLFYSSAAQSGRRVVLDGVDGDIVVSTSVPTTHLLRSGQVSRAWREAAARQRLHSGAPHPLRVLTTGALRAWLPGGVLRFVRQLRDGSGRVDDAIRESLIDRGFAQKVDVADRLEQLWNQGRDDLRDDQRSAHARAVTHPYVAAALERYDRVAARQGLEARHPFFDLRLVRLCLSLPWDLKVRNGWTKFVLRLATENRVPDEVRWRRDYGDVLWRPTSQVIAADRSFLQSILHDREDELCSFIDRAKLERVRQTLGGDLSDQDEVWVWQSSTLARWLARHRS